ncbi:MAG: hypothetical protein HYU70_16940 [Bacteroidetes bacterium]|nr:hypothetical protein [Bacteroidota bacterium]
MKKTVCLLAAVCLVFAANAQFSAGQKMIGGQVSMGYSRIESSNSSVQKQHNFSAGLTPIFYRFKGKNKVNGYGLNYIYLRQKADIGTPGEITYQNHLVGAFFSQTQLQPIAKNLYFTLTGTVGANYQIQKNKSNVSTVANDAKGFNLFLRGGIGLWYQLNQRFILTTQLNNLLSAEYGYTKTTSTNGTNTTSGSTNLFGFTTGLNGFSLNSLGIGVNYLLK